MNDLPDLRQVRSLVAVAESESFTRAAEQLDVTQSAISHSIRALETLLDCRLVERNGKRVSLTQQGTVLLRRFKASLSELKSANEELAMLKRWGQGRLRVGATHTLTTYLLPKVLREFRDLYPRCEIHLVSGDTSELVNALDQSEVDLVLGMAGRTPSWGKFHEMFSDQMVYVVAPDHPWAKLKEVTAENVASESFLVYARVSETYRVLRDSFEQAGVRLRPSLALGDMSAIKEMAKVGIGVGIVAPWTVTKAIEAGELVSLPLGTVSHRRSWGSISHETRQLTMVEEDFLRICRKSVGDLVGVEKSD